MFLIQIIRTHTQDLVGRAAAQDFGPALATQGLWALQRGVDEENRQVAAKAAAAAVKRGKGRGRRQPWPSPPPGSPDSYLPPPPPPLEEEEEDAAAAEPAAAAAAVTQEEEAAAAHYWKEAEELLLRAVATAGPGGHAASSPEAQAALATLAGWARIGLGQLQITGGESEGDRATVLEVAGRLAGAASGGHVRARAGLAAGVWDPVLGFDLTDEGSSSSSSSSNSTTSATSATTVYGSGFGRPAVRFPSTPHPWRRACPVAVGLARPAAEMAVAGVMGRALAAYDAGDDASARRLYAIAAEAGLVSAQVRSLACVCRFLMDRS